MTSSFTITILNPIIILFAVFGNVLTITAVIKTRALRSRFSVRFITSLACCDLFFSLLSCPVNFITTLMELEKWDTPFCTLNGYLGMLFCMTSLLTLTVVSVDRYFAIVTPFRYHNWVTSNRVIIIIASTWTLAAVVAAVPLSGWGQYVFFPRKGFCFVDYQTDCEIFIFLGVWFQIGFAVIVFSYYHIFKEARRQKRQIQALTVSIASAVDSTSETRGIHSIENSTQNNEGISQRYQRRKNLKRLKLENKAAITIFATFAGFLGCWTPFVFVNFAAAFLDYKIPKRVDVFSTLLVAVGSCVNPLFYAWLDSSFRLAFKRLLSPILGRQLDFAPATIVTNGCGRGPNL